MAQHLPYSVRPSGTLGGIFMVKAGMSRCMRKWTNRSIYIAISFNLQYNHIKHLYRYSANTQNIK